MKIFEKYMLEELKLPVIFAVSVFTFIFLIDIIVAMMENILVRGISILDTIRILSFYLPPILSQTIPMGVFFGVMITFSKFTKNSESIALTSMGISLKEIVSPILKLTLVITAFIFFLQESIIPRSFDKLQYLTVKIATENPVFQLKDRTFISGIGEFDIYVDSMEKKTEKAKGVLIFQKEKESEYPTILIGKEAFWKDDALILGSSDFYRFKNSGELDLKGEFSEKKIPLSAYASNFKLKVSELETKGVYTLLKEYKNNPEKLVQYMVEINKKIAVPLSTVLLGILGVVLSIGHHRSGKGTNFALSLLVIFLYIVLLNTGTVMAYKGQLHPIIAVWTPNFLLSMGTYWIYMKKSKVM